MGHPLITILPIGILFCIGGVLLFHRNAFEEEKSVLLPILVIVAGVILIALAMAKVSKLIP